MFIVVYDFKDSLLIFDVNYRSNYVCPISNYIVYRLQWEFRIMTKFDWNHFICVSFRTTTFRIWRYPWHVLLFQTYKFIGCSGSSESWLHFIETILFAWVLEQLSLEFDAIPGMFCYFRHISCLKINQLLN
jgi:hypothetical protein